MMKHFTRKLKSQAQARAKVRALPAVPRIMLSPGYVNPVTLNTVKGGLIVYEITNRRTGRKDYFDKSTFWKLVKRIPDDYWLLMADPKKPLPGVRNPLTRSNVYPRNVRRVTVSTKPKAPTRSAAARKIQAAFRARKSH